MTRLPERRALWIACAALVALTGLATSSGWHTSLSGEDFPGHVALLTSLLATEGLPLWNSNAGSGAPLLLAWLHPVGSLLLLSPFAWLFGPELGLRVGESFFLALAGLGMVAWCRALGGSSAAAFLGGLFYALHPAVFFFLGRSGQVHQALTLAVVPLVFLAFRRLTRHPSLGNTLVAGAATAALALDMQRFWLVLPFALIAALASALARHGVHGSVALRSVAVCAAAGLASAALLCFPVLPALLERDHLMGHPPELLEAYRQSFALPHLYALFDRAGALSLQMSRAGVESAEALAGSAYQGIAPLLTLLAGGALLLRDRGRPGERGALALALAGMGLVVALAMGTPSLFGRHLALARTLLSEGPGFSTGFASLALAVAGVVGGALLFRAARDRASTGLAIGLLAAGALLFSFSPFPALAQLPFYAEIRGPGHFAFPMLPFLLATGVSLGVRGLGRAAIPLVAAATLLHGLDLLPYRDMLAPERSAEEERALRAGFAELAALPMARAVTSEDYEPLGESLAWLDGAKPAAWSWIAWSNRRATGDLLRLGGFGPLETARREQGVGAGEFAARIFGLANVRYVVRSGPDAAGMPDDPAFALRIRREPVEVYENRRALPYAQFYPAVALASGTAQEIAAALVNLAWSGVAAWHLGDAAVPDALSFGYAIGDDARRTRPDLPGLAPLARKAPGGPPLRSPCRVLQRGAPEITLQCRFDAPGQLVVAESWAPAWRAEVDGSAREVHRMNLAFTGIAVGPGDREIRLRHEPSRLVRASLGVSSLAWLTLLGYGLLRLARRRR